MSKRIAVVYVLQCGEYVKVGVTGNLRARVAAIQIGNPYPLKVVFAKKVPYVERLNVERAAHARLRKYHHRDEWFKTTPEEAIRALVMTHAKRPVIAYTTREIPMSVVSSGPGEGGLPLYSPFRG